MNNTRLLFVGLLLIIAQQLSAQNNGVKTVRTTIPVTANDIDLGKALVNGDFEVITQYQWSGVVAKDSTQFLRGTATEIPVRQGKYAARFIVKPGDKAGNTTGERCEIAHFNDRGHKYSQEAPGREYFYGWSTLIPEDWTNPSGFGVFAQWHQRGFTNPPISFNIDKQYIQLNVFTGPLKKRNLPSDARGWIRKPLGPKDYTHFNCDTLLSTLHKGLWQDFIVRIRFSPDANGVIDVWHRVEGEKAFKKILSRRHVATMQSFSDSTLLDPGAAIPWGNLYTTNCWVRIGLYRGDGGTNTNTIYHDNWARASTFADIRARFDNLNERKITGTFIKSSTVN